MKNKVLNYLILVLVANIALVNAMDKPPSKGLFSQLKDAFSSKLTPEKATQKLSSLIDGKSEDIKLKTVESLLAQGANKEIRNAQGKTILMRAVEAKNSPVVAFLLQNGANPKSGPLLAQAALNNDINIVRKLITAGADVNATDQGGLSPLYYAANEKNPEIIKLLLTADADVNIKTPSGNTPLHIVLMATDYSTVYPHETRGEIIEALLARGADVTIANEDKKTPAMLLKGTKYGPALRGIQPEITLDDTSRKLLEEMQNKNKGKK